MSLETYVLDLIHGRKKNPWLKGVFYMLARLFQGASWVRNKAYDAAWLPVTKPHIPVISVGNITVGGTGKTPFIHLLAQALQKEARIAILSRGFRTQDEPRLLAQKLPHVEVMVGKKRAYTAKKAEKRGVDLILLDDGMQHRALARDMEIVLLDGMDPLGKNAFLPAGLLRDSPKRLKTADLLVFNPVETEEEFIRCIQAVKPYTATHAAAIRYRFTSDLKGKKVGAFCALAKPERFFAMLERAGGHVVKTLTKEDHKAFSEQELALFAEECRALGAECLVCTEKDYIKILNPSFSLKIIALEIEIEWTFGKEHWDTCLKKIITMAARDRRV